jgi:aquaporin NIP
MKKYLAETLGTFCLVFFGTLAVTLHLESGGIVSYFDIALTFGLTVALMIYFFRRVSGAHINPAVTIGAAFAKKISKRHILPYIIAQLIGAIMGSVVLRLIFPQSTYLGATLPAGAESISFIFEFVMTFILMLTILNTDSRWTGIIVGILITLEAYVAGDISGASMNPARSIGPAVISGHYEHLWVYILAPVSGSVLAVGVHKLIHKIYGKRKSLERVS